MGGLICQSFGFYLKHTTVLVYILILCITPSLSLTLCAREMLRVYIAQCFLCLCEGIHCWGVICFILNIEMSSQIQRHSQSYTNLVDQMYDIQSIGCDIRYGPVEKYTLTHLHVAVFSYVIMLNHDMAVGGAS